jgi:hypothetical protein
MPKQLINEVLSPESQALSAFHRSEIERLNRMNNRIRKIVWVAFISALVCIFWAAALFWKNP